VDEQPTGLRSDVIKAWRNVEKYANADGIIVCLNDGKRSRAQQQAQYDQYLKQYGKQAADQLVLEPDKSAHVTGIAIDVQPAAAFHWLQATRGALGLCRTFDNEGWHFEYDVSYFKGCPPRKPRPEH
jgi:D-alanyl-D-alanine carboxypeptidase